MRTILGLIHGIMLLFLIGAAFLIGLMLDISDHPLQFLQNYWLPLLMFAICTVGAMRDIPKGKF